MGERLFGASVRRREDERLVTGRGRYVADVALPEMLHVAVLRSPHAHARLVKIDADAARKRPGVVHVVVPADVAALGRLPLLVPHKSLVAPACPEILPREIVSYAGQAVALVVAESAELAEDALAALRVEYEPLPAVAMADALRPDAPRVHPGGNVAARFTQRVGDPTSALARADLVLRERFTLHRGAGMAIETRGIVARWDADLSQERDQWHDAELGLTREGTIVALRDSFVHDCGAFVSWGIIVPIITSVSVPGPYRVPNYEVTLTAVYTNRVPVTPVRGAGRPQAVFVMERMLDLAAERLGLDRIAIRERNLIQPDEFPYDVGLVSRDNSPRRYDSGNYPECL